MKEMINQIINYLHEKRGFDFSGSRFSMLQRRIAKRFVPTHTNNFASYYQYILQNEAELDELINVLTIKVSYFFRDALVFELLAKILKGLVLTKHQKRGGSIRIWSAGCASGEEPYSVAIILNEIFQKVKISLPVYIFATDIDETALSAARIGLYNSEQVKNIKLDLFNKYFFETAKRVGIITEIKKMVSFSFYDLLDKRSFAPSESIFGNFDIILCRNVLIYFNMEFQQSIIQKLHHSLNKDGYLFLGEAETLPEIFKTKFKRESNRSKIYHKI